MQPPERRNGGTLPPAPSSCATPEQAARPLRRAIAAGDDFSGRHRMAERLIASAPGRNLPIVQGAGHMIITLPAIRLSMQSMLSSGSPNRSSFSEQADDRSRLLQKPAR